MDVERYQRLKAIFESARRLDGAAREAYVETECDGDDALREEVLDLLRRDETRSEGTLDRVLADDGVDAPEVIGRYRILGVCGHGGMGTVYEARQDSPQRRVAIKVIQAGRARPEIQSRFRREAEILGRLQHPGIAQVHEAGEYEVRGHTLPYIAMEFIEGLPLHEYARRHELDLRQRLELFARVCDAVEYAHEKGVVHRDLKPENVLVVEGSSTTGHEELRGQPKVLDFGVARLVDDELQATVTTGAGQLLGSVPYMSPEQARGDPGRIDRRSDVFSLGVLLYELLGGRLPIEIRDRPLADALDAIRHDDPVSLGAVAATCRGDLDTIVGKCLEKERERRYATVAALVEDLRRHLRHEPITARPPSTWYQARKFARRHRGLVGGAAATALALLVGLIAALYWAYRASENAEVATRERVVAERQAYVANLTAANAQLEVDPLAARAALDAIPEGVDGWERRYVESRLSTHLHEFGALYRPPNALRTQEIVVLDGGGRVACARDARTLVFWDSTTGAELDAIGVEGPIVDWALDADGDTVAIALGDGRLLVHEQADDGAWSVETWRTLDGPPTAIDLDPSGERVAAVVGDTLHVGDATNWTSLRDAALGTNHDVRFTHGGERVHALSSSPWGAIYFSWKTAALEPIRREHVPGSRAFAFSEDEGLVALASNYRVVEVRDVETFELRGTLRGHFEAVFDVSFLGNDRVVSSSNDGTVRVWDVPAGRTDAVLSDPDATSATFLDAERIVTGHPERLRVWRSTTTRATILGGQSSYVYDLAFSADGGLLASYVYSDYELSVWDVDAAEVLTRQTSLFGVGRMGFTPDGSRVWLVGPERVQHVDWTFETSEPSVAYHTPTVGLHRVGGVTGKLVSDRVHSAEHELSEDFEVWSARYALGSPGSRRLRVDGEDVALVAEGEPRPLEVGASPRLSLTALPNGYGEMEGELSEILVFGSELSDEELSALEAYFDLRRVGEDARLPRVGGDSLVAHFRAHPDALECVDERATLVSWTAENDPSLVLRQTGAMAGSVRYLEPDESQPLARLAFSRIHAANRRLDGPLPGLAGCEGVTVVALAKFGLAETRRLQSHLFGIADGGAPESGARDPRVARVGSSASYSADGRWISTGHFNRRQPVRVRDATTGEVVAVLGGEYIGNAMSPDGTRVVCGAFDGSVDLYDARTGALLASVKDHANEVYAVAYSPDGTRIATGAADNKVVIRDAGTLERLLELRGHDMYVKALAFSPDGSLLASASGDGTVRLWDTMPAAERYARHLATERRREQVRDEVARLRAELPDDAALLDAIVERWGDDDALRRAALLELSALDGS